MFRTFLFLCMALAVVPLTASADDPPAVNAPPAAEYMRHAAIPLDRVLKNPDDAKLLAAFCDDALYEIGMLNEFYGNSAAAGRRLKEFAAALAQIQPTIKRRSRSPLEVNKPQLESWEREIAINPVSLTELETALTADPNNYESYRKWFFKTGNVIGREAIHDPDRAQALNEAAKRYSAALAEKTHSAEIKRDIGMWSQGLLAGQRERQIEMERQRAALVGADAPPLVVDAWVNSEPLTLAGLKGKVVLLDFWGMDANRISSVPNIRDWDERYKDKGLVVIAVTRSGGLYQWDAAEQRVMPLVDSQTGMKAYRQALKLPQKIETLQELAKFHKLNYPLTNWGVRDFGNSAYSSLEGPTGLVVIDRQGKIRLVRAIPRADDARDVERLLAELLAAPGGEE
jgi:hypothetical protein